MNPSVRTGVDIHNRIDSYIAIWCFYVSYERRVWIILNGWYLLFVRLHPNILLLAECVVALMFTDIMW